jgi:hypothetical protein
MTAMKENDTFGLTKAVDATVVGEHESVVLAPGTVVTVVLVFGDPDEPVAYEVEAFLPESEKYALATIEASDLR